MQTLKFLKKTALFIRTHAYLKKSIKQSKKQKLHLGLLFIFSLLSPKNLITIKLSCARSLLLRYVSFTYFVTCYVQSRGLRGKKTSIFFL
jgi:hypothetical protein